MGRMFQAIFLFLHVCASLADSENGALCLSPQYMPLGQKGSINCDFGDQFYGVYWYNTSDYVNTEPILYFTNRQKSGLGYDTEEFNIFQNGSLIINNVSLQHEGEFTVIMFREESGVTIPNFVKVIVTVEPRQEHPIIDACNGERVCVQPTNQLNKLTCYVESYRPPNNLSFSIITTNESLPLSISLSHSRNGDLYTTTAHLELPIDNANIINVVSCARSSPPYLLNNDNSVIILQSSKLDLYETKPTKMYVEQGKTAILQCSHQPSIYYVWMYLKASEVLNSVSETIEHPINYEHVVNSKYLLRTGTKDLQVQNSVVDDEGIYICVIGDGIIEYVTTFELNVYMFPEPPSLLVDGCSLGQYCEIQSAGYGLLICRVRGIHPLINITWSIVEEVPKSVVFRNEKLYANKIGDTYDVTINTEFEIKNKAAENIPVECRVDLASNHPLPFHWSRKVYIVPKTAEEKTTVIPNESYIRQSPKKIILPIAAALAIIIIIIITAVLCSKVNLTNIRKPKRGKRNGTNVEEGNPMMAQRSETTLEKTRIFKQQLISKYKEHCEAVRRLPRRKKTAIAEIFVEEDIEILAKDSGDKDIWNKLESYHHIIDENTAKDARIILEGGAGYGKSILCLKMAYDWYKKEEASPLKNIDMFILLYMRYLGNNISLHQAIKQHLLPSDSPLTPKDIIEIISTSNSIVLVLDGFNRWPHVSNYQETEIKKVMMKQKLQNCRVIITTRTAVLPENYSRLTTRMRLSGFDDKAREKYIRMVVAPRDQPEVDRIKSLFEKVPGIFAFCQVPLFFTLLTDLTHQQTIDVITDTTVTKFFQSILDGLREALSVDLKQTRGDGSNYLTRKNSEQSLHREALKGLSRKDKGLLWDKSKFKSSVGKDVYETYCTIGILVEEEVYDNTSMTKSWNSTNMEYLTKVKFYHNVFCEWFASQELSKILASTKSHKVNKVLQGIDPFDHQYVFRFACGLNETAAEHIIKYMKGIKDGDKFATLCIMEKSEEGIKNVKEVIKDICSLPVHISRGQSHLLQRSCTQVLVLAAEHKIPSEIVWLAELNVYFNPARESLTFSSGINLPTLKTMNQLSITETGQELTTHRLNGIFKYVTLCEGLAGLRFRGCLLPKHIETSNLQELQNSKISVDWKVPIGKRPFYRLNLKVGQWELEGEAMTEDKYDSIREKLQGETDGIALNLTQTYQQ